MKVESDTKVNIDGDSVTVTINETQTKTKQEHEQYVYQRKSLLGQFEGKLSEIKGELTKLLDVEEDEETKKIAEMIAKAEKLKEKNQLIEQVKFFEQQLEILRKEIKQLQK